jgi:hypothetical protein
MPHQKIYDDLFRGTHSFATSLVVLMVDHFGTEWLEWTPLTIRMEIRDDFKVQPTQMNFDLLMAGVSLLTQDSFYWSLPDFNDLCNILSGEPMHPGLLDPADAASCAWGITEALLLSPPDDLNDSFSEEIQAYIGHALKQEGIVTPPDILKIGRFDRKIVQKIRTDFQDDPEMFAGIYKAEQAKTEEINNFVKSRLRDLVGQLQTLPIKSGSVERVAELMLKSLPDPEEDEPLPD